MGISGGHLLIILLIVVLLFGTKRLATIGRDLGNAFKGFREAVREPNKEEPSTDKAQMEHHEPGRVIEGKVDSRENR